MSITLKKNGAIYYSDGSTNIKPKKVKDFIPYLREEMIIEEGTTFKTLFNIIMKSRLEDYSKVFASHLGHYPLSMWKKEWAKKAIPKEPDEVFALEIGWHGYDRFDPDDDCYTNPYFLGIGIHDGKEQSFALEFTPIHELKHYPIRLNKRFAFRDNHFKDEFVVNIGLTVYDVIGAILYEISWSGDPKSRDKRKEKILRSIDEAQKELKNGQAAEIETSD